MTKAKDVPISKEKPYITTQCGCRWVLLKPSPKAPEHMLVMIAEDCGSATHNRRKPGPGGFRHLAMNEVVHYDPLADELMRAFGMK